MSGVGIFRGAFVLAAVFVAGAGGTVGLGEALFGGGALVCLAAADGAAGLVDATVLATVGFFF